MSGRGRAHGNQPQAAGQRTTGAPQRNNNNNNNPQAATLASTSTPDAWPPLLSTAPASAPVGVNHIASPSPFCTRCNRLFVNPRALQQHLAHSSSHHICPYCHIDHETQSEMNEVCSITCLPFILYTLPYDGTLTPIYLHF
jgi:hypothetical protein